MKKNICFMPNALKYGVGVAAATLSLMAGVSCSDSFLDVESKTQSLTDNYYKTESDAYRALIGCYDGWQCTSSNGGLQFYILSEIMSDECYAGFGSSDEPNYIAIDRFDLSYAPSYGQLTSSDWSAYYAAVYRCNMLLQKEENIEWKDDNLHAAYIGECHALRAFCYFDMVRLWGNIPLRTEPSSDNIPQADPAEVYKLIVEDLTYAMNNIPDDDIHNKANADIYDGRISRYAAAAMLGRVYLYYKGYYGQDPEGCTQAQALSAVESVIQCGQFGLVANFKDLWPAAAATPEWDGQEPGAYSTYIGRGKENVEAVLTMKFNNTSDYNGNANSNGFLTCMGMRNTTMRVPYGDGWGACSVVPALVAAYGTGDSRKSASIIDYAGEKVDTTARFAGLLEDQAEYTGYAVKKYTTMSRWKDGVVERDVDEMGEKHMIVTQYRDWVIMRYADVLLMAAELGSAQKDQYLNEVRKRAYTVDGELSSFYTEKSATLDNILEERRLELAFEGIRYWDMLRQGIDKAADLIVASAGKVTTGGRSAEITYDRSKIIAKQGLMQIPGDELSISNGVLKQNPGWE